jgi:hypothetical protein
MPLGQLLVQQFNQSGTVTESGVVGVFPRIPTGGTATFEVAGCASVWTFSLLTNQRATQIALYANPITLQYGFVGGWDLNDPANSISADFRKMAPGCSFIPPPPANPDWWIWLILAFAIAIVIIAVVLGSLALL